MLVLLPYEDTSPLVEERCVLLLLLSILILERWPAGAQEIRQNKNVGRIVGPTKYVEFYVISTRRHSDFRGDNRHEA